MEIMETVILVIRIDAGLINVDPATVEEALNRYFAPDGAVSVFYAAQDAAQPGPQADGVTCPANHSAEETQASCGYCAVCGKPLRP